MKMPLRFAVLAACGLAAAPPALAGDSFTTTLDHGKISFSIAVEGHDIVITPAGLTVTNEPVRQAFEGRITGAETGDIDANGSPEVYVYTAAEDAGGVAHGNIVAYAVNNGKSLSQIHVPPIDDDPAIAKGYRGQDEAAVVEGIVARRFPLFDDAGKPTGKYRQLQYKLRPGEAGWLLVVDQVVEF
jgi:hypothetical protein